MLAHIVASHCLDGDTAVSSHLHAALVWTLELSCAAILHGCDLNSIQGPLSGRVSNGGGSRSGLVLPFLSFFVLFGTFPIFLGFSRIARGWSGDFPDLFVLFLFLGLLRAPTRNRPERVRDTIWTFPVKSGKHPGLETPRFSFPQVAVRIRSETHGELKTPLAKKRGRTLGNRKLRPQFARSE